MQAVIEQLKQNLQLLYRKSIDADEALKILRSQGKAKFDSVFDAKAGFVVSSRHFKPYVEEVALNVDELASKDAEQLQSALPDLVHKIDKLFKTMTQFQQSIRD